MSGTATITFTQPGVYPPVYLVTPLSSPPWELSEMDVSDEKTPSGHLIFVRQFPRVPTGTYQYKVRIGQDNWIVDESKETGTDSDGNYNNIVHVGPEPEPEAKPAEPSSPHSSHSISSAPAAPSTPLTNHVKDGNGEESSADHELAPSRSPDEIPEDVIIPSEPNAVMGPNAEHDIVDETSAPLFSHEASDPPSKPTATSNAYMDTIEEESARSSADHTSSDEVINTPSDSTDAREDSDFGTELDSVPLLPHEPRLLEDDAPPGAGEDELDNGPLLPYESGFLEISKDVDGGNVIDADGDFNDTSDESELERAPTLSHENWDGDESDIQAPLLPHESLDQGDASGALGPNPTVIRGDQPFPRESSAPSLFPGRGSSFYFQNRARTGSIPHTIPHSDAEDNDLLDPSLETFPTTRERILERVATISSHLPEDETNEDVHSPPLSVLSQACSSVDLAPVSSYTCLRVVAEAEESLEFEKNPELPSPVLSMPPKFVPPEKAPPSEDLLITPRVERSQQDAMRTNEYRSIASGVSGREPKQMDEKNGPPSEDVYAIATPATVLDPPTPSLTPRKSHGSTARSASSPSDSQKQDGPAYKKIDKAEFQTDTSDEEPSEPSLAAKGNRTVLPVDAHQVDTHKTITQASVAVFVAGIAAAVYYFVLAS